ncbi:MAG: multicopper oxidase domain-containing protein [Trueperaceae bacterium]|nr:MAG: multicopper oxidase domain-containing protein [Trueperaceae bacterium]
MVTRRQFLKLGAATSLGFLVACNDPKLLNMAGPEGLQPLGVPLLDPSSQPKFVNPLPNPLAPAFIFKPDNGYYEIGMGEVRQALGLYGKNGKPLTTTVWGYGGAAQQGGLPLYTFPGRTFEVCRDESVYVQWRNNLPIRPHLLPVDESLHWAFYHGEGKIAKDGVPVVPHLHGGHTESDSDGLPEYWWTPGEALVGPRFVKSLYTYHNDQEAGTLWYHDHALGITRLNVYAGLAGFYILRDDVDTGKPDNPLDLPTYPYEVPLVIQDRVFTHRGELFLPTDDTVKVKNSVVAEFFGDVILVNGVAWPKLDVEPRKYRFRLLNGSDSRFYVLKFEVDGDGESLDNGGYSIPFYQIGTDDGFLSSPVQLDTLVLGPGERADVIVDFSGLGDKRITMKNTGPDDPFRGLNPDGTNNDGEGGVLPSADVGSTGVIMAFDIVNSLDASRSDGFDVSTSLRTGPFEVPGQVANTRKLVLFEEEDEFGRLRPQLGTLADGSLLWDGVTENPELNSTEIWEVYNATEDAHPIHLHLVTFEILDRIPFTGELEEQVWDGPGTKHKLVNPQLVGSSSLPNPNERGPKDTAQMFPGQMTRIKATFDRPGRYVWHCHILSHEDHEMMRPFEVEVV